MFEGLDQVNWRNLRHCYGSAENIPGLLRDLAEGGDEEVYLRAFNHLVSSVNHQGNIYSATSAAVPFLIDLLLKVDIPRRNLILSALTTFLESCAQNVHLRRELAYLKDDFATYAVIERGVPIYLSLLDDCDDEIRGRAAYLLMRTNSQRRSVRLRLWRASTREKNPFVHAIMIYGVGNLVTSGYQYWKTKSVNRYREVFEVINQSAEEPIVALGAALAWSARIDVFHTLPIAIARTLGNALALHTYKAIPHQFQFSASLFDDIAILERFKVMNLNNGAGEILHADHLTAEAAHLVIREMLDTAFARTGSNYSSDKWSAYLPDFHSDSHTAFNYAYREKRKFDERYEAGKPITYGQMSVIESIVNCDRFWQIPTNLFSFFYGLPDSREELRALLG